MLRTFTTYAVGFLCLISVSAFAYDREAWDSFPNMNYATALAEGGNIIYMATTGGIRRYDLMTGQWIAPLTTLDGLPDNRVQRIGFDANTGDLWYETPAGAGRWLSNLQVFFRGGTPPPHVYQPHAIPHVPPLIPPFGYYVDPRRIIGPRRDFAITDMLIDSRRNLWIATWGLGIGHADLSDRHLRFLPYGPLDENVMAMARDGDAVWMGGEETFRSPIRGITRYYPGTGTWEYFDTDVTMGLDDAQITVILPGADHVYFGTHHGLMRYEKGANRWLTYRDTRSWGRIHALARDGHTLWIGSDRGLGLLDVRTDSLGSVAGSERAVIRSLITGSDLIWAGTETGLFQCQRGDRTWRAVADIRGFAKRSVRALSLHNHTLWVATEMPGGVLSYTPSDSTWREYPMTEVSGSRRISMAADSAHVWLGTDNGAFLLDVSRHHWRQYTPIHGLIHPRVQAVLRDGEYIWFGTAEGLGRYHWVRDISGKN